MTEQQAARGDDRSAEFTRLMMDGCNRLEREIGYRPTRFRQMVGELGGVGAARQLLRGPATSEGFATLWEAGRLALSVEAHVLLPRFAESFSREERREARRRLEQHGFDVESFLESVGQGVP